MKKFLVLFFLIVKFINANPQFQCGEKKSVERPYGVVELRVDCDLIRGQMWVAEFKGDVLSGISVAYDQSSGKKIDSEFYIGGEKEGLSISWDSLGNVKRKSYYKRGHQVDRSEAYYSPGRPSLINNYNDSGHKDGLQQQWWRKGGKRLVAHYRNGALIDEDAFFENGKPELSIRNDPKRTYPWSSLSDSAQDFLNASDTGMNSIRGYIDLAEDSIFLRVITAKRWDSTGRLLASVEKGRGDWDTASGVILSYADGKEKTRLSDAMRKNLALEREKEEKAERDYDAWLLLIKSDDVSKRGSLPLDDSLREGVRPLHLAGDLNKLTALRQLLAAGANPNVLNGFSESPLDVCASKAHLQCVEMLLNHNADPNFHAVNYYSASNNKTPIFYAIEGGSLPIFKLLLKHHAKVNVAGSGYFETPLHTAACEGNVAMLKLLLAADPSVLNIKDDDDHTALDEALRCGKKANADYLRHAMGR